MKKTHKARRGPKKGIEIKPTQFDDLMDALGKTREEVAALCSGSAADTALTPQAVSFWKSNKHIPRKHFNVLAKEYERLRNEGKVQADVDKRVWSYFDEIRQAQGSATKLSSPLLSETGSYFYAPEIERKNVATLLDRIDEKDLIKALERKGWRVTLALKDDEGKGGVP